MADRYFVPQPIAGELITLAGAEAHHLARVMRAKVGDTIVLFDGSGLEYSARIERVDRNQVELSLGPAQAIDREARLRLTLGVALPKGDRQKWLIEKAVELGTTRIVPLETTRGVAQPSAGAIERLERAVVEASKQCGRNRLMEIAAPMTWQAFLASPAAAEAAFRGVAHPAERQPAAAAKGLRAVIAPAELPAGAELFFAVGPEGGLTAEEIDQATARGWQAVDLGPRILRVETAAIALAAYCLLGT